jgi:putative sigma-54 modulation protein
MRLELTGRHVDITPSLRRLVEGKLGKLERMLNDSAVSAQAVLTREKYRHRAEITLHARGEKFLHGVGNTGSWEASIADAMEKICQQALKVKGKWQERKRRKTPKGVPIASETPEAAAMAASVAARPKPDRVRMPRILRASRQTIRPMSVSEAARQIDRDGDSVVVFRDAESSAINVLYRRRDGELTLVETEA